MGKVWKKLLAAAMVTTQISVMAAPLAFAEEAPAAPEAWGPTPNEGQMKYYKDELAGFVHFGVNQYTGAEWGNGQEDPDPARLPAEGGKVEILHNFDIPDHTVGRTDQHRRIRRDRP